MSRVGCVCINAGKDELRQIALRFPAEVERIAEWERIVAEASKRGRGTFFAANKTPEGAAMGRLVARTGKDLMLEHHPDIPEQIDGKPNPAFSARAAKLAATISAAQPWPGANQVFEWARTNRGGRQFDLLEHAFSADEGVECSSQYGLCE